MFRIGAVRQILGTPNLASNARLPMFSVGARNDGGLDHPHNDQQSLMRGGAKRGIAIARPSTIPRHHYRYSISGQA